VFSQLATIMPANLFLAVCNDPGEIAVLKDLNWQSHYAPEVRVQQ
jgi:hypothetical protein